ncbi:MAG: hypothetical protein F4044_04645 [Rhodobacteraceae bacterium]|nr:hypothetical protein [Paracoccaceae bacterium]
MIVPVFAQTDATNAPTSTVRPNSKQDGSFQLERIDGARYTVFFHFGAGSQINVRDPKHAFWVPPYLVVHDDNKALKHQFDSEKKRLTIWIKLVRGYEDIRKAILKEESVKVDRADVIPLEKAWFKFTTFPDKESEDISDSTASDGEIAVLFNNFSQDDYNQLIKDYKSDVAQLIYSYQFKGVKEETCTATSSKEGIHKSQLFNSIQGEGSKGLVTREQAAAIADELNESQIFEVTCADGTQLGNLTQYLLDLLGSTQQKEVAGWNEIENLIGKIDSNDFRADIQDSLNTIEKEVVRDKVFESISDAFSSAKSESSAVGGKVGYGPFAAELKAQMAEANAETNAGIKKSISDYLKNRGISVNWNGNLFIPKTINYHTVQELESKWEAQTSFQFKIPSLGQFTDDTRYTKTYTTILTPDQELNINNRFKVLEEAMSKIDGRLKDEEMVTTQIKNIQDTIQLETGKVTLGQDDISIDAKDDIRIDAKDDIRIDAKDDIRINGERFLSIESCYYILERGKRQKDYFFNLERQDELAHIADVREFGSKDCTKNTISPRVFLLRFGQDSPNKFDNDNWYLTIKSWLSSCPKIGIRIMFMDGFGVEKDYINLYQKGIDNTKFLKLVNERNC